MWIDDRIIENCCEPLTVSCWQPERVMVVLGSSNVAEREALLENCLADNVLVLQRRGGGGAVVLYPGCIVLSLGMWVHDYYNNGGYFRQLNQVLINSLSQIVPAPLEQKGISDLASGDRKFVGTSLYRSRNYLLYQASIIFAPNIPCMERYLKHPSREPDYRRGRSHRDFLTSLQELGAQGSQEQAIVSLRESVPQEVAAVMSEKLSVSFPKQVKYLQARLSASTCQAQGLPVAQNHQIGSE